MTNNKSNVKCEIKSADDENFHLISTSLLALGDTENIVLSMVHIGLDSVERLRQLFIKHK